MQIRNGVSPRRKIRNSCSSKNYDLRADQRHHSSVSNKVINRNLSDRLIEENQEHPDILDINCVDPLNRSALIAAIENENIDLIKLLLELGIEVKVNKTVKLKRCVKIIRLLS